MPAISARSDLLMVASLAFFASATIACLWPHPWLVALLLLPAPAILVSRCDHRGRGLTMALAGAALGPLTEAISAAGGIWSYADTGGLPLIPPWNLPLWASLPPALALIIRADQGRLPKPRSGWAALAGIGLLLALFLAFHERSEIAILGSVILAAGIYILLPSRETLICFGAGGLLGPLCEAPGIAAGAWSYSNPEILGFPAWLPAGYAVFAALVFQLALAAASRPRPNRVRARE